MSNSYNNAGTNFSSQQLRDRHLTGGQFALDMSLAKVMVPRFGSQCIQSDRTTGSVFINQGYQWLAHNTMNGYLPQFTTTAPTTTAGREADDLLNRLDQMDLYLLQNWDAAKKSHINALGTTPDMRLTMTTAGAAVNTAAYENMIKELNSARFSAYDTQGRFTKDDYLLAKWVGEKVFKVAKAAGGQLLSFSFSDLYHNSLRTAYAPSAPAAWKGTAGEFSNNTASKIHKMNVAAHNISGPKSGGYYNADGTEEMSATMEIKTVMTRVEFNSFPPEHGGLTGEQELAYQSFKDALRFRSFEVAKHMVEDARLWRLPNPHHTFYLDQKSAYEGGPKNKKGDELAVFTSYERLLNSLRHKSEALKTHAAFKGAVVSSTGFATLVSDGKAKPKFEEVAQWVLNWDSSIGTSGGLLAWKDGGTGAEGFLRVGADLQPLENSTKVVTLLEGVYPFTPLGLMEAKETGDQPTSYEKRTIDSVGGVMWRPMLFEWEPTIHIDSGSKPWIVNTYAGRKHSEQFLESMFDRTRYYAVVFAMVDDDDVHHYYAEATHDYSEVEGLIKAFHDQLRAGEFEGLRPFHVGFSKPRAEVSIGAKDQTLGNEMEAFMRARRAPADLVPGASLSPAERSGLMAPAFPIFSHQGGSVIFVPELIDTDIETAKSIYLEIVSKRSETRDEQFAKQFGFLVDNVKEWTDIVDAKARALDGNKAFLRMADVPKLDGHESQKTDPFPHGLRGLHSHQSSLATGVALREQRVDIDANMYKPLVHPAIVAELAEMMRKVKTGTSANGLTELQGLTRYMMSRDSGGTYDEKAKRLMRRHLEAVFPKDRTWGMVQTAVNILNNALSERVLSAHGRGEGDLGKKNGALNLFEQVQGYRFMAQTLLNNLPHLGELKADEVFFVVEHDLIGKLYEAAETRRDPYGKRALAGAATAWREYVVSVTPSASSVAQLPALWRNGHDHMMAPSRDWQKDNFFLDGSNSNDDHIRLFVFKYDDNAASTNPGSQKLGVINIDVPDSSATPVTLDDFEMTEVNALPHLPGGGVGWEEIPNCPYAIEGTSYNVDSTVDPLVLDSKYYKTLMDNLDIWAGAQARVRLQVVGNYLSELSTQLDSELLAATNGDIDEVRRLLTRHFLISYHKFASAYIHSWSRSDATTQVGAKMQVYDGNKIVKSLRLIISQGLKTHYAVPHNFATLIRAYEKQGFGLTGTNTLDNKLPTYREMADYFSTSDFDDWYKLESGRLQLATGRDNVPSGGTKAEGIGKVNDWTDVFHSSQGDGMNDNDITLAHVQHVTHHDSTSWSNGRNVVSSPYQNDLTSNVGKNMASPISLLGKTRTLICSSNTRHLKVADVMRSLRTHDGKKTDKALYDNLCQPGDNPGEGIGIVWIGTNRTAAAQPTLTTDLRKVVTAPSLDPVISDKDHQRGCIFFKFPQGCLVPEVQSFSLHMAYWNVKLGNSTTMERVYGDRAAVVIADDEYDKNTRDYFNRIFGETQEITDREKRQAALDIGLTGREHVQTRSSYRNSTYDADAAIKAPAPSVTIKPPARQKVDPARRQRQYMNRFGRMYTARVDE